MMVMQMLLLSVEKNTIDAFYLYRPLVVLVGE